MLLLTFEGLSPVAISCYGSSWNRTESIDAVAADGTTWDRVICNHTDPLRQLSHWLRTPGFMASDCTLVTDDERLADLDAIDEVGELILLPPRESAVADSLEGTMLAALASVAAEQIAVDQHVWLHSRFLTRCWDAPRSLFPIEHLDAEDDFPLDASDSIEEEMAQANRPVAKLEFVPPILDQWQPPQRDVLPTDDPDWIMAWMRTYGCQVRLIDEIVGLLSDIAAEHRRGGIAIAGTSGFALGQNQTIGHRTGPLRSCHVHVPFLLSRFAGATPDCTGIRSRSAMGLDEIARIIGDGVGDREIIGPSDWSRETQSQPVVTVHADRPAAVTTNDWFFVDEANDGSLGQLFLKPDDACDVNDVARLRPGKANDLADYLTETHR